MQKYQVASPSDALLYITDCNLATVSGMAMLKTRKAGEYKRQVSIAQHGIDWIRTFGIAPSEGSRVKEILDLGVTVAEWAKQYEVTG